MAEPSRLSRFFRSPELERKLDQIPTSVGSLGYDPWGLNLEANRTTIHLFRFIYRHYFRVEANGVEQVPAKGPVLIVANHSGQLPIDALLIAYAVATRDEEPRIPRAMIERFFPTVPWIGNWLNAIGGVLGDPVNCSRMLARSEAIIVFPEGVRGSGKLYKDRYQLKRFGNGFMHLAMQSGATIIPVGVVGCEETIPAIANIRPLAKLLNLPYVPVALPLVLPAKVILNFGEAMHFEAAEISEDEVARRVDTVKEAISRLIDQGLEQRRGLF